MPDGALTSFTLYVTHIASLRDKKDVKSHVFCIFKKNEKKRFLEL